MSAEATFTTTVLSVGNNTGIEILPDVIVGLGAGQSPTVFVTVGSYSWSTTAGVMGGRHLILLSKAHRDASGIAAGHQVEVHLQVLQLLDTQRARADGF